MLEITLSAKKHYLFLWWWSWGAGVGVSGRLGENPDLKVMAPLWSDGTSDEEVLDGLVSKSSFG